MNLEEFETEYRARIEQSLNRLQTAVLLLAQLEARIVDVGQDLQDISHTVEEFLSEQRAE